MNDDYYKDHLDFFADRTAALRKNKSVSARDMSLSIGQDESYIGKLERKQFLPSMTVFFNICDFLGITPQEFFESGNKHPGALGVLMDEAKGLDGEQLRDVTNIVRGLVKK